MGVFSDVEELLELASGTTAVDVLTEKLFILRAHLLAVFGDIPAITKILEFIGHNGRYPCRFCLMMAIQGLTAGGGFHLYCPLDRLDPPIYDALKLPLRTHKDTLNRGLRILNAPTDTARSKLATDSGIKGVSSLARLPSVNLPASFPIDIMHMVYINLIPHLVHLWTGNFNGLDAGAESYIIPPKLWESLGETIEGSGSTIPSSFGSRAPNLALPSHGYATAESWSIFATYLAPSLLRRRFRNPKYYRHFVQLIGLLNICTSYDIPRSELPKLRKGFAKWIKDYELQVSLLFPPSLI